LRHRSKNQRTPIDVPERRSERPGGIDPLSFFDRYELHGSTRSKSRRGMVDCRTNFHGL
ncbi:hypothetical protein T03_14555, partial [Trichinella britovi]